MYCTCFTLAGLFSSREIMAAVMHPAGPYQNLCWEPGTCAFDPVPNPDCSINKAIYRCTTYRVLLVNTFQTRKVLASSTVRCSLLAQLHRICRKFWLWASTSTFSLLSTSRGNLLGPPSSLCCSTRVLHLNKELSRAHAY
ncbi:uncharacterized protein BKA78DRAFT_153513 [Phyllosticta capitalensis]|uniref:uncharacterized protein n=1 Tax=Phyllosticta capitalensis TaxID=121624 RepID=UPI00312FC69A